MAEIAAEIIDQGHNLVLIGQAGCGKTFFIKNTATRLINDGKKVGLTASTGIAATHLGEGATTIHRWGGLEDGRHSSQDLCKIYALKMTSGMLMRKNEFCHATYCLLTKCQCFQLNY